MKECGVNIKGASQFLETDITLQGEFLFDGSLQNRITEPLRLEKTSKIIKSNCHEITKSVRINYCDFMQSVLIY